MPLVDDSPPALSPLVATRVWDLPTRVFHIVLALAVTGAIVTAKLGGNWMPWHLVLGETVLTLIVFRWIWGFVGGHWSRFAQFLPSPRAAMRHLRGRAAAPGSPASVSVGHSPLGALSVWAFLLLLSLQVATGLVADDEISTTGPLNAKVSAHLAARASGWHAVYGANLIMALIALHVLAVAYYTWVKREAVLRAMWSGDKALQAATRSSRDGAGARWLALILLLMVAAAVSIMVRLAA